MFIGVLLVLAALIGGILLLVTGDGDDDSGDGQSDRVTQLQDDLLKKNVVDVDRGISVRIPKDWDSTKQSAANVIIVQSPDGCVSLSMSAPAGVDDSKKVRDDAIALFKRSFKNARVVSADDKEVGGIPTTADTVLFKDQKGNQLSVLVSVGKGSKYTYLTEVVVKGTECQGSVERAQLILSSIEYTK